MSGEYGDCTTAGNYGSLLLIIYGSFVRESEITAQCQPHINKEELTIRIKLCLVIEINTIRIYCKSVLFIAVKNILYIQVVYFKYYEMKKHTMLCIWSIGPWKITGSPLFIDVCSK